MRRLLAFLSALGGVVALVHRLRRRGGGPSRDVRAAGPDARAEALRRRLDESRAVVDEQDSFGAAEVPVDRAEAIPGDPDTRRRTVHAEARAAAEAMRRPRDAD